MRIARIDGAGRAEFVFTDDHRSGWVTASALGVDIRALDDIVDRLSDIRERMSVTDPDRNNRVGLLAPVERPGKILAVGLNYLKHIEEVGKATPPVPLIFAKYPSAVTGPHDVIELNPGVTAEVDYECELAVVIGAQARRVDPAQALNHVLGYCVANDVSARDVQRGESQISRSKGLDTFCPVGPWITTADEVADPHQLDIRTTVNGEIRQDSNTEDMLFDVPFLIAYLSQTMTLHPGDVILTGTPPGVGSGMKPPIYLQENDVVRCEIEALGYIENRVVTPMVTR
ncbi:fumarylacetoacetate hydrolase family protein [Micromonospora sp. NBC_01638]|uniref:fumarylacetoacetate hydrolase family protein n=1 Tax=Micromonospora sp. NBC_01638 TaxID=2975982 RepID=UPI00386DDE21|nr:fumarylacetoacetate hydrolase family protein [Micromonospora sp. NBC_01638]